MVKTACLQEDIGSNPINVILNDCIKELILLSLCGLVKQYHIGLITRSSRATRGSAPKITLYFTCSYK